MKKKYTQKYKIETLQMQMWRNWRSKIFQWNWFALRLLIDFQLIFNWFAYVQAVYSLNVGTNIIFGMAFKNISWILPLNRSWHVNCIFLMLQIIFEMEFIAIICNRNKKCLCDKWIIHLLRISSTRFIDCNNRIIVNWIAWNGVHISIHASSIHLTKKPAVNILNINFDSVYIRIFLMFKWKLLKMGLKWLLVFIRIQPMEKLWTNNQKLRIISKSCVTKIELYKFPRKKNKKTSNNKSIHILAITTVFSHRKTKLHTCENNKIAISSQ